MRLTPRYDGRPVIQIDTPFVDLAVPVARQRSRLAERLAGFDEAQWATPSRCDGWTVKDVVAHLVGTDQFWSASVDAALRGEPTRYLERFNPVATPAQMVDAMRALPSDEVLAQYVGASQSFASRLSNLDEDAWESLGEAPPGHIPLRAVAMHALWDPWIHERDVLIPLGLDHALLDDEIELCLQYAAALNAGLGVIGATRPPTSLTVVASQPDIAFSVVVDDGVAVRTGAADGPRLEGDAVSLIEGLSVRAPLAHALPPEHQWLVTTLGAVFASAVA